MCPFYNAGEIGDRAKARRPASGGRCPRDTPAVSPYQAELDEAAATQLSDPRRARPSPHVSFSKRTLWQSFRYDWLGNTSTTQDDAAGFYDRSLGAVTNGTTAGKPYQLHSAAGSSGDRTGHLQAVYDASGNLTGLGVVRQGPCIGGATCSMRFAYQWDEVGRLVRARRWDLSAAEVGDPAAAPPTTPPAADLRYAYDAGDQRVATEGEGIGSLHGNLLSAARRPGSSPPGAGSVPRDRRDTPSIAARGTEVAPIRLSPAASQEVDRPAGSDSACVRRPAGSATRTDPAAPRPPLRQQLTTTCQPSRRTSSTRAQRAPEARASTSLGEVARPQAATLLHTARAPARGPPRTRGWGHHHTGKEEDVEVGLTYFGKRYLNPLLGRWVSPDPLAVHVPGEADWDLYAYVSGQALKNTDPLGLDPEYGGGGTSGTGGGSGGFRSGGGVNNAVDNSVDSPDAAPTSSWTAPSFMPKFSSTQAERDVANGTAGAPGRSSGGGSRGTSGSGAPLPTPPTTPSDPRAALDAAGFTPGPTGIVADLANAGWSAYEKDWAGAGLNAIAAIPVAGDAIKGLRMGAKAVDTAHDVAKAGEAAGTATHAAGGAGRKIPNADLQAPPGRRGNAPVGSDGHPVELHHRGERPDSPLDEMTRTDHRGKGNFSQNHSNTGQQPSQIDRKAWKQEQKDYWGQELDSGRFDDL